MVELVLAGVAAVVVLLVGVVAVAARRRYIGGRVLVRMDDEVTLEGRLVRRDRASVTVDRAKLLGDNPRPIDGEIVVERSKVIWMQVP